MQRTLTGLITLLATPLAASGDEVVGDIRGASRPDEIVIMGAHLDSWDEGTGAIDDDFVRPPAQD